MEGNWVSRRWTDFRSGHSTYLTFFLSFMNFSILMYEYVISGIPFLLPLIPNLGVFLIFFLVTYVPTAASVGYVHRRVQMKTDSILQIQQNLYMRELFKSQKEMALGLKLLAEDKDQSAIEFFMQAYERIDRLKFAEREG